MIEKYLMSENNIPDGILHDQSLYNISLEDSLLTLSFETHLFSDMIGNAFCEKYKNFTKCHIKCRLEDEYFCNVYLWTALNKKMKAKVKLISIPEFVDLVKTEFKSRKQNEYQAWNYIGTSVSPNTKCASVELMISLRYKGVTYSSCHIEINTSQIEFIWE